MTEEGRYQVEARALRAAAEGALGALLAQSKDTILTREVVLAALARWREVAGIDFGDPAQRAAYRNRGGV